ncbi:uncharacterized protein LOC121858929 [Homarus americanus]|uniref:uncharacterized protein LOC121858929 n=1 Tax=Homarus americanus TaxID=6706 RepID=UPI001C4688E6|nr:uncharacterized protein LOC121858929 [Homarus americanus]
MKIGHLVTLALALGLLDQVTSTLIVGTVGAGVAAGAAVLATGVAALGAVVLGAAVLGAKRRGKREATQCLPFADADLYLSMAINSDSQGCTQRFMCEISSPDISDLTKEEQFIKDVFASNLNTEENTPKALFARAAALGAKGGALVCAEEFHKCPFDRKILMQAFLKAQTQ